MSASFSSLNLVVLGPPGSGKKTQAGILAERYCIPHIATGDLLRDEVAQATELGHQVAKSINSGRLVPDRLVGGIILQRLYGDSCARGFVLDGYPRTVEQAGRLDGILAELGRTLERVALFDVPDEVAIRRLIGRRVHAESGREYHVETNRPHSEGLDDVTGDELLHRIDDHEAVVRERLQAYRDATALLAEMYRRRGLLVEIDGNRPQAEVTEAVLQVVGAPVGA